MSGAEPALIDRIHAELGDGSAWHIVHERRVTSTMDAARALLDAGLTPRLAVVADSQSAGRGRRERVFVSPEGGLYLTAALAAPARLENAWRFGFAAAVASARALEAVGRGGVRFDWPNDLVLGGRKIAGILSELLTGAGAPGPAHEPVVLVGVGLNTGPDPRRIAPNEAGPAGTLDLPDNGSRARLCGRLLRELGRLAARVQEPGGWADALESVRSLSDLRGERTVRVRRFDGGETRGTPWNLLDDGSLELREASGALTRVRYGEVVRT